MTGFLVRTQRPGGPTRLPGLDFALCDYAVQRSVLLGVLRSSPQSRTALAEHVRISGSVITRVVQSLLNDELLVEVGTETSRLGRPPTQLDARCSAGLVVSALLQVGRAKVQATDLTGAVRSTQELPLKTPLDPAELIAGLRTIVAAAGGAPLRGLGLAAPGVVGADGSVREAPDLGITKALPLGTLLAEQFGVPVVVDNDVNLAVLAEQQYGDAADATDAVLVHFGRRGIGLGTLSKGELLKGAAGGSGEIGMLPLDLAGPAAQTPRFEDRFSVDAAAAVLRAAGIEVSADPIIDLLAAAHQGRCVDYCTQLRTATARVIGVVSLLFDPSLIVLGGGAGTLFTSDKAAFTQEIGHWLSAVPPIAVSALGEQEIHWTAQGRCWDQIVAGGI